MDVVKINDLDTIALSDDLLMLLEKTSETIGKKATIADLLTYVVNSNALSNELLGKIYPTGSIYISVNNVSPASFIGGTWEALKDRFLIGAGGTYAINATGGEANHTLTEAEMPSHKHNVSLSSAGSHHHRLWSGTDWADTVGTLARGDTYGVAGIARNSGNQWCEKSPKDSHMYMEDSGSHSHSVSESAKGSNNAHNNLPPYLAVYMWKRTA